MPQTNDPVASLPGSQIGSALKELRDSSDLSLAQVVAHLQTHGIKSDTGTLSRIEQGKRRVTRELAEVLLNHYGAGPDKTAQVLGLIAVDTTRRRRPALWRTHSALITSMHFEPFLSLERRADHITSYQTVLIPGLLQTHGYACRLIALLRPDLAPDEVEGLATLRISRQKTFAQGDQRLRALICERALTRSVGDPAAMREQLEHLLAAADSPRHEIRILPFDPVIHPGAAGPFVVFHFDDTTPDLVCVETMTHSVYFEGKADVRTYTEVHSGLWDRALPPGDPRIGLQHMIKELRT
ncbi:helix-turn-helix transcriptional regulator [Streptomyces sp. NPDC020875]|uniref:helix-turn-helix domain-containing protein n=1 Tax=Streptomyces sp. NPDC020875 TaxID=3154898 RepID=UPI0033E96091